MFVERIGGSKFGKEIVFYKFEKIKRVKVKVKEFYFDMEFIDMGVGEFDEKVDMGIIGIFVYEVGKDENRGYVDNGIYEFKVVVVKYLERVYGVKGINFEIEVNYVIGLKLVLVFLFYVFINFGDVIIMIVLGYFVLGIIIKWFGGEVYNVLFLKENNFLLDLLLILVDIRKRVKFMYLNYFNNLCGVVVIKEFFEEVVKFVMENNIIVVYDVVYVVLVFDGYKLLFFLLVEGVKEVGVEIYFFFKVYNMIGWWFVFVVGNEFVVKVFVVVKDNNDFG